MTHEEFCKIYAYVTAGCGQALNADSMRVYFDLLKDIPFEAMEIAAKRVIVEHRWPSFPSIAELRSAGVLAMHGNSLSAAEAWGLAWNVANKLDLDVIDPDEEFLKAHPTHRLASGMDEFRKLPTLVQRAMQTYGLRELSYSKDPVTVIRAQFMKVFEQLSASGNRDALLPPSAKNAIGVRLPSLAGTLASIGKELPQ